MMLAEPEKPSLCVDASASSLAMAVNLWMHASVYLFTFLAGS